MASPSKEVARELLPLLRVYKDGSVERLKGSPYAPPSLDHPQTKSKDIKISQQLSARVYLPQQIHPDSEEKLPILLYFHGGGFCIESSSTLLPHRYLNLLVSQINFLAISVDYRLAPENPLPAAYEDSWTALQWISSNQDPWVSNHGDLTKIFIGGDSAGANIVHNLAIRAGIENLKCNSKIYGAFLAHPYFWSSKPVGSESNLDHDKKFGSLIWDIVYPSAENGIDNFMVNPVGPGAPSLEKLGCSKIMVFVAGKDELRDRGVWYFDLVRESGWKGEIELFEVKDEGHVFHMFYPETDNARIMLERLTSFLIN